MKELDVRHLSCPGPVIEVRKLLDDGERELVVHVADELARSNVTRFATSRRAQVSVRPDPAGGFAVSITAGEASSRPAPDGDQGLECPLPEPHPGAIRRPLVVQVTGEAMGRGDDELGELLMRSFLKTQLLVEPHLRPDAVIFYNAGVTLCCEGSPLLEDLRTLEAGGVEIIACGTCLNYFQLASRLAVGRGSDMLEIAGRLAEAGHVVRP